MDPNRVNLSRAKILAEKIAIIKLSYAPIFNKAESAILVKYKDEDSNTTVLLNRSHLDGHLIILIKKYIPSVKKYEAIELGYSNADSLPWGHESSKAYTIDETGNMVPYLKDINGLTFVELSFFI